MARTAIASALLAVSLLAVGCGGGDSADDTAAPTTEPATVSTTPTPDEEQRFALLERLGRIDPALAEEDSVDTARAICLDLRQGKDQPTIERNAAIRFGVDPALAPEIIAAVQSTFCQG